MSIQSGANTVALGERVMGRAIWLAPIVGVYLILIVWSASLRSSSDPFSALAALATFTTVTQLAIAVYGIVNIVLLVTRSAHVGALARGFRYVKTDTREDAKGMAFVKVFVQGLFELATLGLGVISYFVTFRDGQHWMDRAFNITAVPVGQRLGQPRVAAGLPQPMENPGVPRVTPVPMPQPGSPFGAVPPPQAPLPPAPPVSAPVAAPAPPVSAPSNPWALSEKSSATVPAPSTAPTASPVASQSFAPPGQAPLPTSVPLAPSAPVPSAVSPSLLNDETVIDADLSAQAMPVLVLDGGERVPMDGPVVLGRNPVAPAGYPAARAVQAIDESMRVSKTHMLVLPVDGGISVLDLGATNGVYIEVGGQRVRMGVGEPNPIPRDAIVHFGGRSFQVEQ